MRRFVLLLSFLVAVHSGLLCGSDEMAEDPVIGLLLLHDQLMQSSNDAEAKLAHERLKSAMRNAWNEHDFWECNWAALGERMGVVTAGSGNQRIAVITWNIELQNRTQQYGGFIISQRRDKSLVTNELIHKINRSTRNSLDTKKRFKAENWPGAVYYDIIAKKQGQNLVFTLLGWDGADGIRSRKIVETLTIQNGKLRFGVPILDLGRGSEKRLILEHADAVTAMLRWRDDLQMIVMDHLSAPEVQMKGNTSFYGPDMTYDGLIWQKKHWVLKKDIELRDPDMKKPWNNPKRLRRKN